MSANYVNSKLVCNLHFLARKSYSYDEETLVRHDEREGSPDIQPGVTRNSIAFYENLKKN